MNAQPETMTREQILARKQSFGDLVCSWTVVAVCFIVLGAIAFGAIAFCVAVVNSGIISLDTAVLAGFIIFVIGGMIANDLAS